MNSTKASFGSAKIFGRICREDIIVHVDRSVTKRKKKKSRDLKPIYGHTPLSEKELDFLWEEKPKVVYVGTGYEAALPITEEAQKILGDYETFVLPTPEILDRVEHEKRGGSRHHSRNLLDLFPNSKMLLTGTAD